MMRKIIPCLLALVLVASAGTAQAKSDNIFNKGTFDRFMEGLHNKKQPTTAFSDILDSPQSYKGMTVLFDCRFHKIDDVFNTVYSPFFPSDHINLAIWDKSTRIWTKDGFTGDYPYVYAQKKLNDGVELQKYVQELRRYERLRVLAKVISVFDKKPYLELIAIKRLDGNDDVITEKALLLMRLGEQETKAGNNLEAAKLYMRSVKAGLSPDYEAVSYRRAGELHLKLKNFERSLELLKLAYRRAPKDPGLADLVDVVQHILVQESGGTAPITELEKDAVKANAKLKQRLTALQRKLDDVAADNEKELKRLRSEIGRISDQKLGLLEKNAEQGEEITGLKNKSKSQNTVIKKQQRLLDDLENRIKKLEKNNEKK